jgi:ABC-type glycerol-3-phosphate transport system substrate-binding protein
MASLSDEVRRATRLLREFDRGEIDRREFIFLAGSLSAVAIAAACSTGTSGNSTSGNQNATGNNVVPFYTTENDPGTLAFMATAIRTFQTAHTNIQVPVNLYSDGQATSFLENAFRTKHDVGIFSPNVQTVPGWAQAGYLMQLDDVVKSIGVDDFIDGTRITLNGHDYQIPFQKSATGLWYRKDVLAQVGVHSPPTTYDDWVSVLKMVNGRNGMIGFASGIGGDFAANTQWHLTPFIAQQGWGYYTHDGKLTFNQPEVFDGIQRFINLMKNYSSKELYNAGVGDPLQAFVTGRAVFADYTGRVPPNVYDQGTQQIIDGMDFMGAPPAGPFNTGKLNMGFAKGYCVYAGTKAPKEALELLQSITSGDSALMYALTVPGQPLPPLKSVTKSFLDPSNKTIAANKYMSKPAFRDAVAKVAALVPYAVNDQLQMGAVNDHQYKGISNVCPWASDAWKTSGPDTTMLQEVLINGKDAKQSWQDANSKLDQAAKNWLSAHKDWKPAA